MIVCTGLSTHNKASSRGQIRFSSARTELASPEHGLDCKLNRWFRERSSGNGSLPSFTARQRPAMLSHDGHGDGSSDDGPLGDPTLKPLVLHLAEPKACRPSPRCFKRQASCSGYMLQIPPFVPHAGQSSSNPCLLHLQNQCQQNGNGELWGRGMWWLTFPPFTEGKRNSTR